MKKGLLGTTALVAAAAAMTTANAEEMMAEPISISIGGHSTWGAAILGGTVPEGDTGIRTFNNMKVTFAGSTVLDNGLEVGVNYKLTGTAPVWDDIYTDVSGAFGTIRLGNSKPAAYKMATAAPYATYIWGINTPTFTPVGYLSTYAGANKGDDVSLLYFTPSFNGLSAAVSYAPEANEQFGAKDLDGGHIWSIGARYDGAIGEGTSVSASAGYVIHNVAEADAAFGVKVDRADPAMPTISSDPAVPANKDHVILETVKAVTKHQKTDMAIGMSVSMAGVSVGGSYRRTGDDRKITDNKETEDAVAYDFGLSYGMGPWAVSVNYGHSKDVDEGDKGTDHLRILGRYSLGAGVTVTGAIGARQPTVGENEESKDETFGGAAIAVSF